MTIQGLRDTTNFVTDQRPQNWRQGMLLLDPNGMAPLTGLTSVMKSESTDDPQYNWWEKELASQRIALGANLTTVNTTITVASGALQLKDGHLLRVEENGEVIAVNGDPSSDTSFTGVRGYSGTTAAAVDYDGQGVNPNLVVVGNAYEEGSDAPTGINYDPTKRYNYTQIFRDTLEATRTATKTRLRTGDAVREAKRECLQYHSIGMERGFIFGNRTETTKNGKPLRTTGGLVQFISDSNFGGSSDYVKTVSGGSLDMDTLESYLEDLFLYGSSEKMGFCGNRALLAINQAARKNSTYNIGVGEKEFGMRVTRLICPYGELVLKTHPLFNLLTGGTTGTDPYYGYNSSVLILDMERMKYRYLTDSDTKYEPKLQSNGMDGMKSGYLTECGLELGHPKTHRLWHQFNAGAADT